jgi:hypothetical protein
MKMILEDMYSTTVAVLVLTVEVYSRYEWGEVIGQLISQGTIRGTAAAGNRDHPAASILQLRSRQIDHRTTVYKVGDEEGD